MVGAQGMFLLFFTKTQIKCPRLLDDREQGIIERIMNYKDEISTLSWFSKKVHWNVQNNIQKNVNSYIQKKIIYIKYTHIYVYR